MNLLKSILQNRRIGKNLNISMMMMMRMMILSLQKIMLT